jgi:hypothetical protein
VGARIYLALKKRSDMPDTALSFDVDIKPLFRESDRTSMTRFFDLWSASDVAEHGPDIAARLSDGSMPCDGAWPAERVAIFKSWLDAGAKP